MLKCDLCHKPLKEKRFQVTVFLRPEQTLTVGPDCYKKMKKAAQELRQKRTPEEITAMRLRIAAGERAA